MSGPKLDLSKAVIINPEKYELPCMQKILAAGTDLLKALDTIENEYGLSYTEAQAIIDYVRFQQTSIKAKIERS